MPSINSILSKRPRLNKDEPSKPLLRGKFHRYGFYISLFLGLAILLLAKDSLARLSFVVYFATVLLVYGVSSVYHLTEWSTVRSELFMQKLDHACIFLLIAGTYTPVCILCLPFVENWVKAILGIVWCIAVAGIIKCLFFMNIPKFVNVLFYLLTGFVIVPFLPLVLRSIDLSTSSFFIAGGAIYAFGGIVYGLETPDPLPEIFGYHEIFHLCTVVANLCFAIPITSKTVGLF